MARAKELNDATQSFIEELGLFFKEFGLPRSTGRVLGLLLICKPNHQSAEQIQEKLRLSGGSVSGATSLLIRMGIIQRRTIAGNRRLYYELDPDCWQKLIQTRLQQMKLGTKIANKGLRFRKDDPRLLGMRDLYTEFEGFLAELMYK
jgi:DNA-binding transcriptional regulator GbsR (MarR family)